MTAPGGDHGEPYRDQPGRDHPGQPAWEQFQHPPVDPAAPVNYPEYPYPPQPPPQQEQPPPYGPIGYGGPPPPPYGGPSGYGGSGYGGPPPMYPGAYDPYQGYPAPETNNLAVASLITSIAGIPLSFLCFLGLPLAIVGAVLGIISLSQINRTHQQGRGLAIAGIAIGSVTLALLLVSIAFLAAHHVTFGS